MAPQFISDLAPIIREMQSITGSMTTPELNQMLAGLDLAQYEHQGIRLALLAELAERRQRFLSLYSVPKTPAKPSLLEWARGWVSGLFGRRQIAVGAWS